MLKTFNFSSLACKSLVLGMLMTLIGFSSQAQITVTVDTGMNWIGYMNYFHPTGGWAGGTGWAVPDLKTEVNPANGSMKLKPNFNTYNPQDTFWVNGTMGNKNMEANTYVEDTTIIGQNFTFEGYVDSFTIDAGYTVEAFIKVLDPNAGWATVLHTTAPITSTGMFTVSDSIPNTAGLIPQYGFTVHGVNANPADEASLGYVLIRGNQTPPPPMINVNLQVQNAPAGDVYVQGSWDWGIWPGIAMTAAANDIHEVSLTLPADSTIEYLFVVVDGADTTKEAMDPAQACTNGNAQFTNRMTTLGSADADYCVRWETCIECYPLSVFVPDTESDLSLMAGHEGLKVSSKDSAPLEALTIYDVTGRQIYSTQDVQPEQLINVSLQSGVFYLVSVKSDEGVKTFKVVLR